MKQKRNINDQRNFSRNYSFLETNQLSSNNTRSSSAARGGVNSGRRGSSPYVFGSAAPKIEQETFTRKTSGIEVLLGEKSSSKTQTLAEPSASAVIFGIVAVLLVCFLAVGVINVSLSSATQASALEAQTTQEEIDQARESGKSLEVALGSLSNPTRIKEKASDMGLAASSETIRIDLSGDKVVLDESGNISLSGTLSAVS